MKPLTAFVPKGNIDTSTHIQITKASFSAKPHINRKESISTHSEHNKGVKEGKFEQMFHSVLLHMVIIRMFK